MADIRINQLPVEPTPSGTDALAIDGVSTRQATVTNVVIAGRPTASQAEAEAGTDPTKAMTPLTTAQAIAFQGPGLFSTKLQNFDGTTNTAGALIFAAGVDTWMVLPAGLPNQFLQNVAGNPTWTNASGSGDVVGPASAVSGSIPTYNTATGKLIQAGNPLMSDFLAASKGPMPTCSNNVTDAVNDIDFSAGACFSSDATNWPMVGAAMTKQLDAAWAAGTNAGGRMSAAAIANTTYHYYMIRNPTSGAVDYGFDVSATAPTLPAGYTQYRRILSIPREAGSIIGFRQVGNVVKRVSAATDRSSTAALAASLLTLSVPIGIQVQPILIASLAIAASSDITNSIADAAAAIPFPFNNALTGAGSTAKSVGMLTSGVLTNTSGQILYSVVITAGTITSNSLATLGWVDTRGN